MRKVQIDYFPGNSRTDPGWYWWREGEENKFKDGPFFSYSDAAMDADLGEEISEPSPSVPEVDPTDFTMFKKAHAPTVEYQMRTSLLFASMGIFCIISWYGVYKLALMLMGF